MTEGERTLTEGDVKAIVDSLEERMVERFQKEAGKGFLAMLQRALFWVAVSLIAYGTIKSGNIPTIGGK